MTTKVIVSNESSNTGSDIHDVVLKRAYNGSPTYDVIAILKPGEKTEAHVWANTRITVEEVS